MSQYYTQTRSEMNEFIPQNIQHVLEVGCAEGSFLNQLQNSGEKWGIEPNSQVANTAKEKLEQSSVIGGRGLGANCLIKVRCPARCQRR